MDELEVNTIGEEDIGADIRQSITYAIGVVFHL